MLICQGDIVVLAVLIANLIGAGGYHDVAGGERLRLHIHVYGRGSEQRNVLDRCLALHSDELVLIDVGEQILVGACLGAGVDVHQRIAVGVRVGRLHGGVILAVVRREIVAVRQQVIVVFYRQATAEGVVADIQVLVAVCGDGYSAVQHHGAVIYARDAHRIARACDNILRYQNVLRAILAFKRNTDRGRLGELDGIEAEGRFRGGGVDGRAVTLNAAVLDGGIACSGIIEAVDGKADVRAVNGGVNGSVCNRRITYHAAVPYDRIAAVFIDRKGVAARVDDLNAVKRDVLGVDDTHLTDHHEVGKGERIAVLNQEAVRCDDDRALVCVALACFAGDRDRLPVAYRIGAVCGGCGCEDACGGFCRGGACVIGRCGQDRRAACDAVATVADLEDNILVKVQGMLLHVSGGRLAKEVNAAEEVMDGAGIITARNVVLTGKVSVYAVREGRADRVAVGIYQREIKLLGIFGGGNVVYVVEKLLLRAVKIAVRRAIAQHLAVFILYADAEARLTVGKGLAVRARHAEGKGDGILQGKARLLDHVGIFVQIGTCGIGLVVGACLVGGNHLKQSGVYRALLTRNTHAAQIIFLLLGERDTLVDEIVARGCAVVQDGVCQHGERPVVACRVGSKQLLHLDRVGLGRLDGLAVYDLVSTVGDRLCGDLLGGNAVNRAAEYSVADRRTRIFHIADDHARLACGIQGRDVNVHAEACVDGEGNRGLKHVLGDAVIASHRNRFGERFQGIGGVDVNAVDTEITRQTQGRNGYRLTVRQDSGVNAIARTDEIKRAAIGVLFKGSGKLHRHRGLVFAAVSVGLACGDVGTSDTEGNNVTCRYLKGKACQLCLQLCGRGVCLPSRGSTRFRRDGGCGKRCICGINDLVVYRNRVMEGLTFRKRKGREIKGKDAAVRACGHGVGIGSQLAAGIGAVIEDPVCVTDARHRTAEGLRARNGDGGG